MGSFFLPHSSLSGRALESPASPERITVAESNLFLPSSFEQYLSLTDPIDVSFSEDYIAIADGKNIHLYDREKEQYFLYSHPYDLSSLQFSEKALFFSDRNAQLYQLDPEKFLTEEGYTASLTSVPASAFLLEGNYLFAAAVTNKVSLYNFSLDEPLDMAHRLGLAEELDHNVTPCLAYYDSTLYCAVGVSLYSFDLKTYERHNSYLFHDKDVSGLSSVCFFRGEMYFTIKNSSNSLPNGLYIANREGDPTCLLQEEGFSALTVFQDELYAVCGNAVVRFSFAEEGVSRSDYEISSSSQSVNRLAQGKQIVRGGDLLLLSDGVRQQGVTVYSFSEGKYSYLNVPSAPSLIATDGEKIAVASADGKTISLFDKTGTPLYTHSVSTTVVGIAVVYGKCYYVTGNGGYGVAERDAPFIYREHSVSLPYALTSDLYGNLYVGYGNGAIYSFTEKTFTSGMTNGVLREFAFPIDYTSLRSDYEGNLYALSGNDLYCNGQKLSVIDHTGIVSREGDLTPLSFALGFEDERVYFLYDDFVASSDALAFPTLTNIGTEDVREEIFGNGELSFVTIRQGAVGIETDPEQIKSGVSLFPYLGKTRMEEETNALLLAQTEDYFLVVLFKENRNDSTFLIRKGFCDKVDESEYSRAASGECYLTTDATCSLYPCAMSALRSDKLQRAQKVSLLAVVNAGEGEYAHISYLQDGEEKVGYLPYSFLTTVTPKGQTQTVFAATLYPQGEIVFTAEDGRELTLTEETQVEVLVDGEKLIARYVDEGGKEYTAEITEDLVRAPVQSYVRVSLIVVLSAAALLVLGLYVFIRSGNKKKT